MTVEIIGGEPILDLTTTTAAGTSEQDVTQDTVVTTESDGAIETGAVEGNTVATEAVADDKQEEPEYYFGDERVVVEVPPEVEQSLKDAGLETTAVLNELFKKDGVFSLSSDTREKLDSKYGKTVVDSYLKMFKTLNDGSANERKTAAAGEQAKVEAQHAEYNEVVGGIDGLEAIEAYVIANLSDKQIQSYNAVMSGDNHEAHMLVLSSLKGEMTAKASALAGDKAITLVGDYSSSGSSKADPLASGAITRDTYYELMATDEYQKNPAYQRRVDNARMMGKRKNI